MNPIVQKLIETFFTKKKIIGWIAALAMVAGAGAAGMQTPEFKEAVCGSQIPAEGK